MNTVKAIGLMSGTSMDGIDAVLIETDGGGFVRRGPGMSFPYGGQDRALLRAALDDARAMADRNARPGSLAQAEELVTQRHAQAVDAFLKAQKMAAREVHIPRVRSASLFPDFQVFFIEKKNCLWTVSWT